MVQCFLNFLGFWLTTAPAPRVFSPSPLSELARVHDKSLIKLLPAPVNATLNDVVKQEYPLKILKAI